MKQTATALKAWLEAAIATGGTYDPADVWVGLATAVNDQQQATDLADVTELAGAGYARVPIVAWSAVYPMQDGRWACDGPIADFRLTGVAAATTAAFWFMADDLAAGALLAWEEITPPKPMVGGGTMVSVVVRLTIDPDGRFSATVVWNG